MAGTYVKKDFGLGPEEQTLLKDSNGTRIVPTKGAEPVRLSPGWEGTGRTEDELNFKGVTMDQADMELNPPRDRWNIVFLIMILHGIGALMPWNMFITASDYFSYKFSEKYTGIPDLPYAGNFLASLGLVAQFPNVLFNWINIFLPLGGNLTNRIAWGIFTQVIIFVFTVIMAMLDTSTYPGVFYYVTLTSIFILNTSLGIYQNSVFGMAAKLPGKYTGGVVLGANISGTFSTVIRFLALYFSPNERTSAIYYFITALFVLLACFDTYFALPINRYFRYHEYLHEKDAQEKLKYDATSSQKVPLWKVFKQCSLQCFNIWFIFFVTLSTFPAVQAQITSLDANFIIEEKFYANLMCFMSFNVSAMLGSFFASLFQFPSKKLLIVPVLARTAFIPLFLMCNYAPGGMKRTNLWIEDDWVYLGIALAMGFSSGYFSSSAMMFCSSTVEPQYASTAGMFASAFLVTGVFSGVAFSYVMPSVVTYFESMG